jgi:hypothetical protein
MARRRVRPTARDKISTACWCPRIRALAAGYPELLAAAVLGLSLQPLAWAAGHQGINILLASLVCATALTIEPAALGRLAAAWPSLKAALAAGITVLPALSWAAAKSPRPGRCTMAS